MKDVGTKISTLWIVVMFNIVYADILGFIMPGQLQAVRSGQAGVQIAQPILLAFAVLLEIPIAMIFLSRVLKLAVNRRANTVAAVLTTAFVVGGGSSLLHYWFFETVNIACMALIVWLAWSQRLQPAAAHRLSQQDR